MLESGFLAVKVSFACVEKIKIKVTLPYFRGPESFCGWSCNDRITESMLVGGTEREQVFDCLGGFWS